MNTQQETALIFCEGAYATLNGKTAHGLVRLSRRFRILGVIDSTRAGRDAGILLDGHHRDIPLLKGLEEGLERARGLTGKQPDWLLMGLAPDGGRLDPAHRPTLLKALSLGINLMSGLHDFLSEDPDFQQAARISGARVEDVRRPPERKDLHFFTGEIDQVAAFRVAILGTDSAVGKRTTAWLLEEALNQRGLSTELIGTGQTARMQGVRTGIILDSLVNDFVSGELEHAVVSAWRKRGADCLLIEGQGSLLNPAYPGGFEILAATRPQGIILQHDPLRQTYDGFPGFPLDPLPRQVRVLEEISRRPVLAVTLSLAHTPPSERVSLLEHSRQLLGLPVLDPLTQADDLAQIVLHARDKREGV